jgi:adenosylcobyric acid synthase
MALNSYITDDGLEMGRAQAVQAEAAGIEPSALMNPILLKPTSDTGSQVIVNGKSRGNMSASQYFKSKGELAGDVRRAYEALAATVDAVVIEGAGSPAELNLMDGDFVNMGMARIARAPVLLVGDIERGGVFAQLAGTLMLLGKDRDRVKGVVVNKFRGDISLFEHGRKLLSDVCGKPVVGVVPWLEADLEDEDSLSERLSKSGPADIAVIRLPRLSNFTDFTALEASSGLSLRYASSPRSLGRPPLVIIPGTKSTISDLRWLRESGMEAAILKAHASGSFVLGICGGYQMMGLSVDDPEGAEGGGSIRGMGLLPTRTVFRREKTQRRAKGVLAEAKGLLSPLRLCPVEGYEIHMGTSSAEGAQSPLLLLDTGESEGFSAESAAGTCLHGLFDSSECRRALFEALRKDGDTLAAFDYRAYKQKQYDLLADGLRSSLDMGFVRKIMEV